MILRAGACYNGNSATASMDMSQFFHYNITKGSWLYFSATVQVSLSSHPDSRICASFTKRHARQLRELQRQADEFSHLQGDAGSDWKFCVLFAFACSVSHYIEPHGRLRIHLDVLTHTLLLLSVPRKERGLRLVEPELGLVRDCQTHCGRFCR